jgi:Mg2+ and Co2+ transporter CorA
MYRTNLGYIPELEWSLESPVVMLLMLAICGTFYYCFRKAAWLQRSLGRT